MVSSKKKKARPGVAPSSFGSGFFQLEVFGLSLYDGVFIVTTISTRDYGQPDMQHREVSSRINERSGMNYD